MGPDTTQPWSGLPQDLQSPITVISDRLGLLQRQLLRADGLTTLEREMMLGTLAAARGDLETLASRLHGQTHDRNQPPGGNDSSWSRR
jgi:hypothetical protein